MAELVQPSGLDMAMLLSSASVEITSRGRQVEEVRDAFSPDRDVTITFLPGDNFQNHVATAAALRQAGFNPVPHLAAREIASRSVRLASTRAL